MQSRYFHRFVKSAIITGMKIKHCYNILSFLSLAATLSACRNTDGSLTAAQMNTTINTASSSMHDHSQHKHGNVDITDFGADAAVPAISFSIKADSMSGWNIKIHTQNFTFTPEKINTPATLGEGHAHIFVDGYKIARIYSHWFHLKALTPGNHEVRINLNSNSHENWSHEQKIISATHPIIQH